MDNQAKKLVLSKETLRGLDDQDLSSVAGGSDSAICVNSLLCNSGVCNSVVCQSAVCYLGSVVCI